MDIDRLLAALHLAFITISGTEDRKLTIPSKRFEAEKLILTLQDIQ